MLIDDRSDFPVDVACLPRNVSGFVAIFVVAYWVGFVDNNVEAFGACCRFNVHDDIGDSGWFDGTAE